MKLRLRLKHYNVMMIRDPKQSVLRIKIPAFLLVAIPVLFAGLCIYAYFSSYRVISYDRSNKELLGMLNGQKTEYQTEVSGKDQTIEHLQEELLKLSERAEELDTRMEEIRKVEDEMKKIVGLNPDSAASSSGDGYTGMGGNSRPVTDGDTDKLIQDTSSHYESIKGDMNSLHDHLNDTLAKVQEQQRLLDHIPSIWPVDSRTITSPFGMRRDPFSFAVVYHSGMDIGAPTGSSVYAGASGTVSSTGSDAYHGLNIIVDHGNGLKTWYMHLSKILVNKNDMVQKGQIIGQVGSTGRSTGSHLHYEMIKNGESIDPKPYLKGARKEE